jgi:DNA repair exonuclease SbcCD ATPase subunit
MIGNEEMGRAERAQLIAQTLLDDVTAPRNVIGESLAFVTDVVASYATKLFLIRTESDEDHWLMEAQWVAEHDTERQELALFSALLRTLTSGFAVANRDALAEALRQRGGSIGNAIADQTKRGGAVSEQLDINSGQVVLIRETLEPETFRLPPKEEHWTSPPRKDVGEVTGDEPPTLQQSIPKDDKSESEPEDSSAVRQDKDEWVHAERQRRPLKLKRVEIQGFKSFCERTELRFNGSGIAAIVGPNGCGKSNLADAISWVLGERSAKALRCTQMEDVIFAGTRDRKPLGMAYVTMTLVDPERCRSQLQAAATEAEKNGDVTITRRLYRSGESEYLIDGRPARLRDIQDFFIGTGFGPETCGIIEQGRMGQVLSSKAQDRRSIIEEAAGITKYRTRRRLAEAKLDSAKQDLSRVFAILKEAIRQVKSLNRIEALGPVNPQFREEFHKAQQRHNFLSTQRQDLIDSIRDTEKAIQEIDQVSRQEFAEAFEAINANFRVMFQSLFGGGTGEMRLTDQENLAETGIDIVCSPPGKRLQNVLLLSGGEKALAAVALLMAIFRYQPSPFCVMDEVDAPLAEADIGRFCGLLREMSSQTQFVVITHSKTTMDAAQALYEVTMQEPGVSRLVSLRFREEDTEAVA